MEMETLVKAFVEAKEKAHLDYAILEPDKYGSTQRDVNDMLAMEFGDESRGIWLKHWLHGVNKGGPIAEAHWFYVAHDITDEQAEIILEVFRKYFTLKDEAFAHNLCIYIEEKNDVENN